MSEYHYILNLWGGMNVLFQIAICDDEQMICSQIEKIILTYFKTTNEKVEVQVFYSGEKLCEFIEKEHSFDLIFLDIELERINGIEVGMKIRKEMDNQTIQIIYISGKDCYDRELFEVRPMHFLPKPLDEGKIIKDVLLAMKLNEKSGGIFTYKKGQETYKIPIKNILYFESIGRQVKIVTTDGEELFYGKLRDVLTEVSTYRFMHIHKSYIVSYAHVITFRYESVIMSNLMQLPISQPRRKAIRELQVIYEKFE